MNFNSMEENLESKYSHFHNVHKSKETNTNPRFNGNKPHLCDLCNKHLDVLLIGYNVIFSLCLNLRFII